MALSYRVISQSEPARRIGTTPQNLNQKAKCSTGLFFLMEPEYKTGDIRGHICSKYFNEDGTLKAD